MKKNKIYKMGVDGVGEQRGTKKKSSYLCRRGGAVGFLCSAYPATVRSHRQSVYHVSLRDIYRGGAECGPLDSASAFMYLHQFTAVNGKINFRGKIGRTSNSGHPIFCIK